MKTKKLSKFIYAMRNDEEDAWWEEDTQQSSDDNYLLGFDDDVDDTHDMELYMEDY